MAPFRGRAGRGGGRGSSSTNRRLARSGIRTKNGYKKFDSQRVKDVDPSDSDDAEPQLPDEEVELLEDESDVNSDDDNQPAANPYHILLSSLHQSTDSGERTAKRRKIESYVEPIAEPDTVADDLSDPEPDGEDEEEPDGFDADEGATTDHVSARDPFETHFANPDADELSERLRDVQAAKWRTQKQDYNAAKITVSFSVPESMTQSTIHVRDSDKASDLHLKERLAKTFAGMDSDLNQLVAPSIYVFEYCDVLFGNRTLRNATDLRTTACLHALNHVLKGRDKVLKNNERLSHADTIEELECRDQGFVRPKVLLLLETRQMAVRYANSIVDLFQPDQQENRKRFNDSFDSPIDDRNKMPEDFCDLFDGNNDNSFLTALKLTRKTMKFYSAFYNSDIIIASPLGLRRIIENEDNTKRDHDFLSSIEIVIVDQADAMQMQSWENVEIVFKHLNLELKEAHGCDFNRVRNWYLDGNAKYLRQTIIFSGYITPEMNRLFNTHMLNVTGKAKITSIYAGTITETSGLGVKQTFSRFDSPSPSGDPDARFKFFTTAILPNLLRLTKPAEGGQGILIFIPSYFDFLRLRNFFATSTQTQNVSFGTVHDYAEVSDQRRARSHFLSGRHTFLLYTQRAHHFFRLKIRGVKRVVMYGLPDNPIFYREMVDGMLGGSVSEGKVDTGEASVRCAFSKWEGMKLERIVGSQRVKAMLGGVGDTFDFV